LYGKKEIEAWVVDTHGEPPINYWVPVNDLMQLIELYKMAKRNRRGDYAVHIRQTLEAHFTFSSIARINYETRILATKHSGGQELIDEPLG
jgi:hypothetical protein